MSNNNTRAALLAYTTDSPIDRPADCVCWGQADLPCWPCFRAGFETPNDADADA